MYTVLIGHHDRAYAEGLERELRAEGFRVITCPGPWPPARLCIRHEVGYCPLTEGADALVYDPSLTALAIASGRAHPDLPLVLAWPGADEPTGVAAIQRRLPHATCARQSSGVADCLRAVLPAA